MDASAQQMNKINEVVKNSVDKIEKLAKQSEEISKLVVVIKEIAANESTCIKRSN